MLPGKSQIQQMDGHRPLPQTPRTKHQDQENTAQMTLHTSNLLTERVNMI